MLNYQLSQQINDGLWQNGRLLNEHKLQIKLLPREGWLFEVCLKEKNNKEKEKKERAKPKKLILLVKMRK